MGNGPAASGDGYRYRGRGPLQPTGKSAYAKYGKRMGVDLVADPDLLLAPDHILLPSLYEWQDTGCNAHADKDDALSIARIINVGTLRTKQIPNGYADQQKWLAKARTAIAHIGWQGLWSAPMPAERKPAMPASPLPSPAVTLSKEDATAIQERLRALGYAEAGVPNGDWGSRSAGALTAFQIVEGLPDTAGVPDAATLNRLFDSRTKPRPVSTERAEATVASLRPDSPTLQATFATKVGAGVLGFGSAAAAAGKGVLDFFGSAADTLAPVRQFLDDVPGEMWAIGVAVLAFAIWRSTRAAEEAKVAAFRDGTDAGPA